MSKLAVNRYLWLIDTVYQAGEEGITFEQICNQWKNCPLAQDENYPLRTFHNHRQEIRESFNIDIQCRKSTNSYFIPANDDNSLIQKLVSLISMINFSEKHPAMGEYVMMESAFKGEHFMATLLPAIEKHQILHIEYQPFWSEKKLVYPNFAPLGLKDYKQHRYLLGKRENNTLEMIDLKCVSLISSTSATYSVDEALNVKTFLSENFGATIEDIDTEEIMIKVSAGHATYLRGTPLHSSQKEIERKKNYSIFYYYLKPNLDFKREILSLGSSVEVLTPENLKTAIAQEAKKMIKKNS